MQLLQRGQNDNQVRFRGMMQSGVLVDEVAEVVQTQVIAHAARASIQNRETVPLYRQMAEDELPVWDENLLVETGLEQPPGMSGEYGLEHSHNLWKGINSKAVELNPESQSMVHRLQILANVVAGVAFLGLVWLSSLNVSSDNAAVEEPEATPIAEEYGHGFSDELEGVPDPTAGEREGAPGAAGVGGSSSDGVPDGVSWGDEADYAPGSGEAPLDGG